MLSLTKKVDYGIVALSYLASEPGKTASSSELSRRFQLPQFLLANILKELAGRGMVESIRGVHGGYRLARSPGAITLAEVIGALEDEDKVSLADCVTADGTPRDGNCRISSTCPVKGPIRRVHHRIRALLNDVTLAELSEESAPAAAEPALPEPSFRLPVCDKANTKCEGSTG